MQEAKKQRHADSVKTGIKGAEGQKEQKRKVNCRGGLLEMLFEQIKFYKLLNTSKMWTVSISSGIIQS